MKALRTWRATGILASANAAALGLQFFNTLLVARAFGTSAPMDAYTLAVSIPESLQYILMLATLTIVFTPLFIDVRTQHGENEAWSMALSLLVLVFIAVILVIPLLALLMPSLMFLLAPGFAPDTRALAVELSDLILPGLIYYATAGLLLGICFAYQDFTTAALNTLLVALLNLAAFFVFVQFLQFGVHGLMLGRLLGLGAMQVFLLWRALRFKRVPAPLKLQHARVWNMLTYLPPYMFGAVSGQLELAVNRSLISTLGAGSVAAWGYGQRLADIPIAVLGAAIGTTYLPDFAARVAEGKNAEASAQWNRAALRVSCALAPIAALLVGLGVPLIALLFERGAFDASATRNSALVLAGLALVLPLRGVGGLIVRGLPAFRTRVLPLVLSALSSGISIAFAFGLLGVLGLFGVALAASIGDIVFVAVGTAFFWRRLSAHDWRASLLEFLKIVLAALVAGVAGYAVAQGIASALDPNAFLTHLLQVAGASLVGAGIFAILGVSLNVVASRTLMKRVWLRAR